MKKLTAGIFATLLAVVSADGAYAAIASSGYVDDKVGEVSQTVTTLSGTVSGHTTSIGEIEGKMGTYGDIVTHNVAEFATAAEGDLATSAVQPADITNVERTTNKTQTVNAQSTEAQYPSAKAVWNAVSSVDANASVEALEGRVDTLEATSATHATKTELAGKQDKLSQTGSASQPVYVNAEGKVTAGNTIPTVTTSITTGQTGAAQAGAVATALAAKANSVDLGALAKLNAVGSAQITDGAVATADIADKAVTEAKLSDTVNASLDLADSALQEADLADYVTKEAADAAYADIATETTASTASTNAQTALSNIGTLSQLTTDAKGNTVAAINEVAKEAADAATAAAGAKTAADTAQGDVDALEAVVNHETTGLAAAHTAIDALESGKLDKTATAARATADASGNVITTTYATKEEVADLPTSANLALKQDKTDNSLTTTNKTVVGAINEVKTTADGASTAAGAAQDAADAAQTDATQALADAAAAQEAAEAAQTAADSKLPTSTYNTQVGTVTAGNMGTTATTVVAAIKEVAGEASTAQSTATAAQQTATQAQQTANAAIPAPDGECADGTAKCVLTFNNSAYAWEVIARNGEGE